MKLNVTYQEEVNDNGTFIISATVSGNTDLKLLASKITFENKGKEISIAETKIGTQAIEFSFKPNFDLAVLNFDRDKFINNISLPEILLKVKNKHPQINVVYNEDPFIKDFAKRIIQTDKIQLSYSIYSSGNSDKKRPLVLFLHGSGERGFNNQMPLYGNDVPKTLYEYAKNKENAVILVPQASWAPTLNGWFRKDYRVALFELLKKVEKEYNVDAKRIYLSGLSNGASTTWYMGAKHADVFAALVPCSGYVYDDGKEAFGDQGKGRYMRTTEEEAKELAKLPIWAFHAEDDPTVGILGTKEAKKMIEKVGGTKLKTTIYPKGTVTPNPHASWALAYDTPELLPWLFSQHK